jgi:hypothetical protein
LALALRSIILGQIQYKRCPYLFPQEVDKKKTISARSIIDDNKMKDGRKPEEKPNEQGRKNAQTDLV